MSLLQEVNSMGSFISTKYPQTMVYQLQEPSVLGNNVFVIQLKQEVRTNEVRQNMLVERQYTITFYGNSIDQVISTMEGLSRYMMSESIVITLMDSTRQLKIESFTFQSTFKTENDLVACTGTILTQLREPNVTEQLNKVNNITIRTI